MKNQTISTNNFQSNNNAEAVEHFLSTHGVFTVAGQDTVKGFFEGNDYFLAIYDGKLGNNTMLLTIKNFAQNEDLLIELNNIFRNETQHLGSYHILKFARQATDDVIGLIPTFKAFFGEKAVASSFPKVNWTSNFGSQNTNIAA